MNILLTGAGGVLGAAFLDVLRDYNVIIAPKAELDITEYGTIRNLISRSNPDVIINCAAHTDLEGAETSPDLAFTANSLLPSLLGTACRRAAIPLVHFSSTGCYGNWKEEPYSEDDDVQPTTVHHRSKVSGERAVIASGCEHLILRTGWLYGGGTDKPKNFVWNRLLEARGKSCIQSDATQRGNPTFALEVARQTMRLISSEIRGTYNMVSKGIATRYDYVSEIVALSGLPCKVEPGPAFRRMAAVSPNEAAVNSRLRLLGLDQMSEWRGPLSSYVTHLIQSPEWVTLASK